MLNAISLFSGIGGIDLGLAPYARTVCYVEQDPYCVDVLRARQRDGRLHEAPIWDDVTTFDGEPWRGGVDLIHGGFPCQPFSVAGKRKYEKDPRHLWPEFARIIDEARPAFVFAENVAKRAFREAYDDLRRMGYRIPPGAVVAAASVGAGHIRRRRFLFAYCDGFELREQSRGCRRANGQDSLQLATIFGNPEGESLRAGLCSEGSPEVGRRRFGDAVEPQGSLFGNADGQGELQQKRGILAFRRWDCNPDWWASEPGLARLVYGVPCRVDRLKALGNAVVPAQARKAWEILTSF